MDAKESESENHKKNDDDIKNLSGSNFVARGNPTARAAPNSELPACSEVDSKSTMTIVSTSSLANPSIPPATRRSEGESPTKSASPPATIGPSSTTTRIENSNANLLGKEDSSVNSGNDRVTVDNSHQPLVASGQTQSGEAEKVTVAAKQPQSTLNNSSSATSTLTKTTPSSPIRQQSLNASTEAKAAPPPVKASQMVTTEKVPAAETLAPPRTPAAQTSSASKTFSSAASTPLHTQAPEKAASVNQSSTTPQISARIDSQSSSTPQIVTADAPAQTPTPVSSANSESTANPTTPLDEAAVLEAETRKVRAPLVDRYSPFIVPSDTSLKDARHRLQTALEQTRKLRAAFTERVYGKYRVCLQPPPTTEAIFARIANDPAAASFELQSEIRTLKEEKDIEKKEAQKLNAELMAANASEGNAPAMNADNAEQLMFISAGLSLVILPEQDVTGVIDMSAYPDRAPTNPETGQRVRSISAAAAAAGEVILDRARKGAAMRVERQRRRDLQIMSGADPERDSDTNYSRLSVLSSTACSLPIPAAKPAAPSLAVPPPPAVPSPPSTKVVPTSSTLTKLIKRSTATKPTNSATALSASNNAKAVRARVQTNMSINTLLSLHPSNEELRTDGKASSATIALTELGSGSNYNLNCKSQQQRTRHPYPESLGGRRRAINPTGTKKEAAHVQSKSQNLPIDHTQALPPVKSMKERRSQKRIAVLDQQKASTIRAKDAIQGIFNLFQSEGSGTSHQTEEGRARPRKRRVTEIGFLHGIQNFGDSHETKAKECSNNTNLKSSNGSCQDLTGSAEFDRPIDPILALNVLKAIGFVRAMHSEELPENNHFLHRLDVALFQSPNSGLEGEEGGLSRRSLAKLNSLYKSFSSRKRTFTDAFLEGTNHSGSSARSKNCDGLNKMASICKVESGNNTSNQENAGNVTCPSPNQTDAQKVESMSSSNVVEKIVECPPTLSIRGGGEILLDSSENGSQASQAKGSGQQAMNGSQSTSMIKPPESGPTDGLSNTQSAPDLQQQRSNRANGTRMQDQSTAQVHASDMATHQILWDDPARQSLVVLNPHLTGSDGAYGLAAAHQNPLLAHVNGGPPGAHMPGQPHAVDRYRQHSTANALQLAHHLRHATVSISRLPPHGHHGARDLADYLGGLHHSTQSPGGYNWSSIGAASAAAVAAASSSLAALGISPHRAAMANFQDRAARVLLAREQQAAVAAHAAVAHHRNLSAQQAVAFLGGAAGHGYAPAAAPHFQQLGGHSAATAALLSSSAALMGHSAMQPVPTSVPSSARIQANKQDQRSLQSSKKEQTAKKEQSPAMEVAAKKEQTSLKDKDKLSIQILPQKSQSVKEDKVQKSVPASTSGTNSKERLEKEATSINPVSKRQKLDHKMDPNCNGKQPVKDKSDQKKAEAPQGLHNVEPSKSKVVADNVREPKPSAMQLDSSPKPGGKNPVPQFELENMFDTPTLKPEVPENTMDATKEVKTPPSETEDTTVAASTVDIKPPIIPTVSPGDATKEEVTDVALPAAIGMQFFVPPAPPSITAEIAGAILAARSYEAVEAIESAGVTSDAAIIIDYIVSVGTAVPIPKALVSNSLKDRLNSPRSATHGSLHAIPREVAVATVQLWLWRHHEDSFQRAFAKSGRIDVDPECKFLISVTIDTAVRALANEVAETASRRSSLLASALAAYRGRGSLGHKASAESERPPVPTTKLDLLIASIVSKALMASLWIDEQMDSVIPQFDELTQYLDECRKCALYSKAQERALLAALVSRKATMSLPFSHAYVSSMVRAGEAIGHGELFEIVQNEEVHASTMIPYDVFTDESGAWEDPCRPPEGFTANLTGDDLVRRAHGRAMIQKSLKKLQDRHSIKGGTATSGAYADPASAQSSSNSDSHKSSSVSGSSSTPRGWLKRQRSSFSDPPVQPGTGSAEATSWSLYDPRHYSAPLLWKSDDVENAPYGRHDRDARPRSLSLGQFGSRHGDDDKPARGKATSRTMSFSSQGSAPSAEEACRSTREIDWAEVAGIFQRVTLPGAAQAQKGDATPAPGTRTIFAPYVRKVETPPLPSEEESEDEEDLSDDAVLERHQIVLDRMKEKLSEIFEARKKHQERRKKK